MLPRSLAPWMVGVAAVSGAAVFSADEPVTTPAYQLTAVERKLVREEPAPETELESGSPVHAGDLLHTGSRSSADILCPEAAARFRIGPKTTARLASEVPGVLLELEEGRLHALLDRMEGRSVDRIVTTPSAVLAVRGTEYGVEVDRKATTMVVVFSGEVEVADSGRVGAPVRVARGQYTEIRAGEAPLPPIPHQMRPDHWDQGHRPDQPGSMGGSGFDDRGFGSGSGGMGSGSAESGAGGRSGGQGRAGGGGRG